MERYPISEEGYEKLERQITALKKEFAQVSLEKKECGQDDRRPDGGSDERDRLDQAAERISRQIKELEEIAWKCEVRKVEERNTGKVAYGSIVAYKDLSEPENEKSEIVEIAGYLEGGKGKASYDSPLGQALRGKGVGDIVSLHFGKHEKTIQICRLYPEWPEPEEEAEGDEPSRKSDTQLT